MDASRARRTRDPARRAWYARYRQWRFARHYGFLERLPPDPASTLTSRARPCSPSTS
ncbi:hypothetical protein ElP_47500 [Tautonia plasticadhaerens]|uniref:Uncharacterized protein n=1 Tax=Tautonia plasticadhaerens TaxID=2527974 RepID=A0A518H7Q4_9BACT|nr:hypothetical protein ElP_47500 [Tautonia plasticadhaerens]